MRIDAAPDSIADGFSFARTHAVADTGAVDCSECRAHSRAVRSAHTGTFIGTDRGTVTSADASTLCWPYSDADFRANHQAYLDTDCCPNRCADFCANRRAILDTDFSTNRRT